MLRKKDVRELKEMIIKSIDIVNWVSERDSIKLNHMMSLTGQLELCFYFSSKISLGHLFNNVLYYFRELYLYLRDDNDVNDEYAYTLLRKCLSELFGVFSNINEIQTKMDNGEPVIY